MARKDNVLWETESCEHFLNQSSSPSLQKVLSEYTDKRRQKAADTMTKSDWNTKISHFERRRSQQLSVLFSRFPSSLHCATILVFVFPKS